MMERSPISDQKIHNLLQTKKLELRFGLFLLCEIYKIFQYNLEQKCDNQLLKSYLIQGTYLKIISANFPFHRTQSHNQRRDQQQTTLSKRHTSIPQRKL